MDSGERAFPRFILLAGLTLGIVLALVWSMVLSERGIRRLYLEFEAYRASTVLAEAFRQSPNLLPEDDRVLGFGIYASDGSALFRRGTAPGTLAIPQFPTPFPRMRIGASSLILERPLGPEGSGMSGMGYMMRRGTPGGQPPPLGARHFGGPGMSMAAFPRALWLEYGIGSYARQRLALLGGAAFATAALLGFFIILVRLYRRNAELRESEIRSRELVQLGEAARTLVHEIKNPLGVIRIQAASLKRLGDSEASEKARAKALLIDDEVQRLAGLADRIREFLKGGEGEAREVDLRSWLRDFSARYSGQLVLAGEEVAGPAWVRVDPERLSLALDNLARNALEACPDPAPELALARRGRHWELVVSDGGPGVPAELVQRIFEPFFTTKEKGTGIGLALARRIARSAGGELAYRPRSGGGAVFALSMPARRGA
ncbi:MAG TPA: HAMP domain-containing sensor histidine kinase [Rectinemataceae bacterium]|nr:HAMP domain-containing sensor histidine kinase [Rectinemataceae bacterium]